MTDDLFISYADQDLDFVTKLYRFLVDGGISVWFDKEKLTASDNQSAAIMEGIRNCKVFLPVLSPASATSQAVRMQVDHAGRNKKQIIPLLWQTTTIPVAMEYHLSGIQALDFQGVDSKANRENLAKLLRKLIGGASLNELMAGQPVLVEPLTVPRKQGRGGRRSLRGRRKASPIAVGGLIISSVVTTFGLEPEEQDWINDELKWLFYASENFMDIYRKEVDYNSTVSFSIPTDEDGQPIADVDNRLLDNLDEFNLGIWSKEIEAGFKRVGIYLKNLDILLEQEAKKGSAGKGDVALQNQISGARAEIVKILQKTAELMKLAYGVSLTAPDELVNLLGL